MSEETSVIDSSPLMHSRIVNSIEYHLTQRDMTEVRENPDVYVTYHTNEKEEMQLHTSLLRLRLRLEYVLAPRLRRRHGEQLDHPSLYLHQGHSDY